MATCPECDAEIVIEDDDLDEMEIGDPWDCDACGTHLRVANLDPLDFETDDEEEADEQEEEDADGNDDDEDDDLDEGDDSDDSEDWDE